MLNSKFTGLLDETKNVMKVFSAVYAEYVTRGDNPANVLKIKEDTLDLGSMPGNSILVGMLAAPINPSDVNQIEGTYGLQPPLPAVAGNECLGLVLRTGANCTTHKQNSLVVPRKHGLGTWRSAVICPEDDFYPLASVKPSEVDVGQMSTLLVNPCTAYLMLKELTPLKEGDVVSFNAASSQVCLHLTQLCKHFGFKSLAVLRDGKDFEYHREKLEKSGATWVVKEGYTSADIKALGVPPVALALNSVGGKSSEGLAKLLRPEGVMATYGGLGKEAVIVPTPKLLFHDIVSRGFWLTKWFKTHPDRVSEIYDTVSDLIVSGVIKADLKLMDWNNGEGMETAVTEAYKPTKPGKTVMIM
ncbi:Zinc-binding dehydrogenase [Carpediemonas membranifera]|uniref:enoyl-[acyl-carrier-protein] reductase n=1 Tax=Carpediemonas membranifera TaxID=201153 RepID=A0A8J6AR38_9EUKA|nr:Zinc-binding dehydrogenase [Carpediemonas membranifera]|eukprot:KAG9392146.1 Zinc-binding dehydrogenase [Carpediemonas membranifera]